MTMHVERGLTTTSTKKRKVKITKAQHAEFERGWRERNVWLREMNLPKETLDQYMEWLHGTGKKTKRKTTSRSKLEKTPPDSFVIKEQPGMEVAHDSRSSFSENVGRGDSQGGPHIRKKPVWVTGPCSTKPAPTYTGTKIMGIGTMHKSNAVPIFSEEEAKDISSMRR